MASSTDQPTQGPLTAPDRSIPLVTLRKPTLDASSSTSLDSSAPTSSPSTPASLTPPTSAHDSSPTNTPERLSRQTTCVSCASVSPSDSSSPPPSQPSTIPRSVPDDLEPPRPAQRQATWISLIQPWDHRRTWVQNTIGLAALAVALVGMFVYALRGYKLAKWSAHNDLLQSCATLIQVSRKCS